MKIIFRLVHVLEGFEFVNRATPVTNPLSEWQVCKYLIFFPDFTMGTPSSRSGKRKTHQPNSINDRCNQEVEISTCRQCSSQKMVKRSSEHVITPSWADSFSLQHRSNKSRMAKIPHEISYPFSSTITSFLDFKNYLHIVGEVRCLWLPSAAQPLNSGHKTDHNDSKGLEICADDAAVYAPIHKKSSPYSLGHRAKTSAGPSNKAHKMEVCTPEVNECIWDSVPDDIQGLVLRKLEFEDIARVKAVSMGLKKLTESELFRDSVTALGSLTSLYLFTKNGAIQWSGFDIDLQKWRSLPTLGCLLPSPGPNYLFKEYLIATGDGLLCANISKSLDAEEIAVCNPMTQTNKVLPPLNSRRNPVLIHILVDPTTNSYKVIVAGSSGMTQGHLSRETEVFDSRTLQWTKTGDLPGPEFGLNEYQTGVYVNGILYCIAFLEDGSGKGVVAYDVEKGKWLTNWKCPLPCPGSPANSFSVAQVVECGGEVYLFSEHENGNVVEHRIDKMENCTNFSRWTNVVRERKSGGRGLLVYPEHACVGFGEGKLCVFNTLELTGKVYDVRKSGGHSEPRIIPSPRKNYKGGGAELFHSLNPLSFTFQPNFQTKV